MLPYEKVHTIREKHRRLGLGLMGIHEWLLKRGYSYEPNEELREWLQYYKLESNAASVEWANELGISAPTKVRAIAPTGTIAILAECNSGIEPIFCVAFKRRYLKGDKWYSQYVIDSAAQRMIDSGVSPYDIEDAYVLANDIERRIAFQAFVQEYVDHGISSTINLPRWGSPFNNDDTIQEFGEILYKYLPKLRGITTYPDGSRGGQPLTRVAYAEAVEKIGVELEEFGNENACIGGVCGI